jgi:hypothetical protein
MSKKISAQNATYRKLLNLVLRTFKFLLNWAGKQKFIKNTNAAAVVIFGIMRAITSSVCLT